MIVKVEINIPILKFLFKCLITSFTYVGSHIWNLIQIFFLFRPPKQRSKYQSLLEEKVSNTERLAVIKEEEEVIHKEREERRAEEREESEKKRVSVVESWLSWYLNVAYLRGYCTPNLK